jgi:hypothetical protein
MSSLVCQNDDLFKRFFNCRVAAYLNQQVQATLDSAPDLRHSAEKNTAEKTD